MSTGGAGLAVAIVAPVLALLLLLRTYLNRSRELHALQQATLGIHGELSLDVILQKVVDQARVLLGARYGALSVVARDGTIERFLASGIDDDTRKAIGALPTGRGLLGVVLNEGQTLRIRDITADPRATGFPAHHPEMRSLLAVPVLCKSGFRGNLYLADRRSRRGFSNADEQTLERFATQAAIAIDKSALHQQLRLLAINEERARIAREMHDGMAQVLAYVNTKAQAVQEFLKTGREEEAERQLEQLAAAARNVYSDVREGILALRTRVDSDRTLGESLGEFLEHWQTQNGIEARFEVDPSLELAADEELQLLRIIQEALANVRKHASARSVDVRLGRRGGRLVVEVEDDGTGIPATIHSGQRKPRFGLAIMRERAESIGGQLEISSAKSHGTRIRVSLPESSATTVE